MTVRSAIVVFMLALTAISSLALSPAVAQLSLQLGGSDGDVKRVLSSQGYSDIAIIKRKFAATHAEACLDGIRYQMSVLVTGQIKWRQEVGNCRRQVTEKAARKLLRQAGYRRVDLEQRRGRFIAIACLKKRRYRVVVDRHGEVRQDRHLGRCEAESRSPTDIAADLKQQGYTRIKFTDRQLPRYVAEACRGLAKVELVLSRRGEIRQENRIGDCRRAIDAGELVRLLEKRGFTRVKVIDDQLPNYIAEACRKGRHLELTLDRYGKISDQFELGRCARRITRAQLLSQLQDKGFNRVKVVKESERGYVVDVCKDQQNHRLSFNAYGTLKKDEPKGDCRSYSVREIAKALSDRGMKDVKIFAEGCRKRRQIRIEFDHLGEPVGRERLGSC